MDFYENFFQICKLLRSSPFFSVTVWIVNLLFDWEFNGDSTLKWVAKEIGEVSGDRNEENEEDRHLRIKQTEKLLYIWDTIFKKHVIWMTAITSFCLSQEQRQNEKEKDIIRTNRAKETKLWSTRATFDARFHVTQSRILHGSKITNTFWSSNLSRDHDT